MLKSNPMNNVWSKAFSYLPLCNSCVENPNFPLNPIEEIGDNDEENHQMETDNDEDEDEFESSGVLSFHRRGRLQ